MTLVTIRLVCLITHTPLTHKWSQMTNSLVSPCASCCKYVHLSAYFHLGGHTWIYIYGHTYFNPPLALQSPQCQCSLRVNVLYFFSPSVLGKEVLIFHKCNKDVPQKHALLLDIKVHLGPCMVGFATTRMGPKHNANVMSNV